MRIKWPSLATRGQRAMACAQIRWFQATEGLSREDALLRVRLAWHDGYESAMRDARRSLSRTEKQP